MTYRRTPGAWPEFVCAENTREYYYNKNSEVPTAHNPISEQARQALYSGSRSY
jgi:hypothetical protein